jgi:hypothetical protein
MTYFKLTTDSGPMYRSFDNENFIVISLFNGIIHKRIAKVEDEYLYQHVLTKNNSEGFVETTEEEFTLNKAEVLAVLNA